MGGETDMTLKKKKKDNIERNLNSLSLEKIPIFVGFEKQALKILRNLCIQSI